MPTAGGRVSLTTLALTILVAALYLSGRSPDFGVVHGFGLACSRPAGRPGVAGTEAIGSVIKAEALQLQSRARALYYMRQGRQSNRTPGSGSPGSAQTPPPAISVRQGTDGRLAYTADADGNRIIDFSHAGYGGGGVAIPDLPARIVVGPGGGQDRFRIQTALDLVAALPLDAAGFRGAVLLERGTYRIDADLLLVASGVVLRGAGSGLDGTVLVATGTSRRSLLMVAGRGERTEIAGSRTSIPAPYVPVGARTFRVRSTTGLSAGTRVVITRPSTKEWIALLGMNTFPGWRPENRLHWQPGSRDVVWDRVVTAVTGNEVTIDAPLTTALDQRYGGGSIARYTFPGRIDHVGVENLSLVSEYDTARPMDEDHAWFAITLDRIEHAWVRNVVARHFVSSVIHVGADARAVTIEDVEALAPVSEVGGYRRHVFCTAGQQTLFRRCRSELGRHDFAVGFAAAGPNVFLECSARDALDDSGPIESWASGLLYDNVIIRGNALRLTNRGTAGQGQGWTAANAVLWNSEATDVEVQSPPGAVNQAYGCRGVVTGDGIVWDPRTMPYRDFYGPLGPKSLTLGKRNRGSRPKAASNPAAPLWFRLGRVTGMPVEPRSLYLTQLRERLGTAVLEAIAPRAVSVGASDARRLTEVETAGFVARLSAAAPPATAGPLRVDNGTFTIDGQRAWTARTGYSWFQAQMPPSLASTFGPALTRFAPGLTGVGLTDEIEAVAAAMPSRATFYQHYGLWYDRRRVDHNYYGSPEQRTGDVWPPFMELPWARSGQGKAWDGLSKYDLTRFNPWYFERVKAFADVADRKGLVLYHNFYFQHWLLESRSHYVDFPWRPTNTIQATGLPDEVPAANVFYDVSHPLRRDLHRRYIRHALDALKDNTNVVHGIDREYTGSIEFVRFWLDTVAEWRKERGKNVFIALEIPKDQMDAILEDPVRGSTISAIDVLGWVYRADSSLFAARGGINRAPREQRPDIATAAELEVLKQKLGLSALDQKDFLNGPEFQKRVIPVAARTGAQPTELVRAPRDTSWAVAKPGETLLVYSTAGLAVELDLSLDNATYDVRWIASGSERPGAPTARVHGGRVVTLTPPLAGAPSVAWLSRVK